MQILNLTPNSLYSVNYKNNSKSNTAFKAVCVEKEISSAIKNLAKNPDLKDIFANPKKKETFMECLASTMVLVAAKITKMVCGEDDDSEKVVNGDVFVKSKQSDSDKVQTNTTKVTQKPEKGTVKTYTKEELKDIVAKNYNNEILVLKRISTIQEHKENAYYGFLNSEHAQYKGKEDCFAESVITKIQKLQDKVLSDKPNEKQIEKFVSNLDDYMSFERITVSPDKSEEIKELLDSTISLINDMYIDKICKKVSEESGKQVSRSLIEDVVADAIKPQERKQKKTTEQLKELPKTHGKHSEAEYSLIKYMDAYKTDVPLYNKFVDVYTKYCGFNRKGSININGKEVQNSVIAHKLNADLAKITDKNDIEKTFDYYLSDMQDGGSKTDVQKANGTTKTKPVKKKSKATTERINEKLAAKLSTERYLDINLSKDLTLNEKLERTVEIIKKEFNLETPNLLLNSDALLEHYGRTEKMYLSRAIRAEISSRKNCPYKNLNKITQADLVDLISQGYFNPNRYNVHSALRFIDRFVLENISDDDLKRVNEITAEKVRVLDNVVNDSMNGRFKVYAEYRDGYYAIHVPVLTSKLSEQSKSEYKQLFGNRDLLLTVDCAGYIHTITKYDNK